MIAVLGGHGGYVYSARFSPDGKLLVTASGDGTARIWNAPGPTAMTRQPSGPDRKPASRIAASPDGRLLASVADNGAVQIYDKETAVIIALLPGHDAAIRSIEFSPDGRRLLTASADGAVRLWDVAGGALIAVLRRREIGVVSAQFSPEGDRIAIHGSDGVTRLYTIFPSLGQLAAYLKSVLPRQLSRDQRRQNFLPRQR